MGSQHLPVRVAQLQSCQPTKTVGHIRSFLGMLILSTIPTSCSTNSTPSTRRPFRPQTQSFPSYDLDRHNLHSIQRVYGEPLLAHPVPLAMVTAASITAMDAVSNSV